MWLRLWKVLKCNGFFPSNFKCLESPEKLLWPLKVLKITEDGPTMYWNIDMLGYMQLEHL